MRTGWWKLIVNEFEEFEKLSDCDLESIASAIKEGCTEGEIIQEWED